MKLEQILAGLEPAHRERIRRALDLMRLQSRGAEALREGVQTFTKDDASPVTLADLLHQSQVQHMLRDAFPGDGLICEEPRDMQERVVETAARASRELYGADLDLKVHAVPERGDVTWILDPIDGTKGYLKGRIYAIALGYFVGDAPFFGAMAVPADPGGLDLRVKRKLAFAVAGRGAWIASLREDGPLEFEKLANPGTAPGGPIRVAVSLEHSGLDPRDTETLQWVKLDSQAKYLAVAAGDLDIYLRRRRSDGISDATWDHMCGGLIAMEAGCRVMHFDGADMKFDPAPDIGFAGGVACFAPAPDGSIESRVNALIEEMSAAKSAEPSE